MRITQQFKSTSEANFTEIKHPVQKTTDLQDIICKAYHAGMIATYGRLIIFGTGAERGTWGQFANVHINKIDPINAKTALTWFTNIYSTALRNKGTSLRKRNFYLSQLQEIRPLINTFGLTEEFESKWSEIESHDRRFDLINEWNQKGKIASWETRTKQEIIDFKDNETTILDSITNHILSDIISRSILNVNNIGNPEELIGNAFIEGTRGLTLSATDLELLMENRRIAA